MSDTRSELLAQLRDIREPIPPEGVPLWLILANIALVGLILTVLLYRRHNRRFGWRKQFIAELRQAHRQPPEKAIFTAAQLLRRLLLYRGTAVQTSSGTSWLQQLDNHFQTQWFTQENGRVFGDSMYQPGVLSQAATKSLLDDIEGLIRTLPASAEDAGLEVNAQAGSGFKENVYANSKASADPKAETNGKAGVGTQ